MLTRTQVQVFAGLLVCAACDDGGDGEQSGAPTTGLTTVSSGGGTAGGESGSSGAGGGTSATSTSETTLADTTDEGTTSSGLGSGEVSTGPGRGAGSEVGTTGDYVPPVECQAVDFVFVIDNSVSMGAEQDALVGAFPGFIDTIQTELEAGSDFHVMVLDTDAWGRCRTANEPEWDASDPNSGQCNDYVEQTVFEECDRIRGAGVVHPAGNDASNTLCMPSSGGRYIDSTEPDLASMFACMATVGRAGHPQERPMNALQAAFEPGGDAESCNTGFLRDDALLVITFISDDGGMSDEGTPMEWYDDIVAAKNGDPSGVVVLGLGPADPSCPGNNGQHWLDFVELWGDRGIHGPVCGTADDYVQFFQDSVTTIDQACEEFVPG